MSQDRLHLELIRSFLYTFCVFFVVPLLLPIISRRRMFQALNVMSHVVEVDSNRTNLVELYRFDTNLIEFANQLCSLLLLSRFIMKKHTVDAGLLVGFVFLLQNNLLEIQKSLSLLNISTGSLLRILPLLTAKFHCLADQIDLYRLEKLCLHQDFDIAVICFQLFPRWLVLSRYITIY